MVSDRLGDPGWPATAGAGHSTTAAGAAAVTTAAAAATSTTAVVPLVLDRRRQGCSGKGVEVVRERRSGKETEIV